MLLERFLAEGEIFDLNEGSDDSIQRRISAEILELFGADGMGKRWRNLITVDQIAVKVAGLSRSFFIRGAKRYTQKMKNIFSVNLFEIKRYFFIFLRRMGFCCRAAVQFF